MFRIRSQFSTGTHHDQTFERAADAAEHLEILMSLTDEAAELYVGDSDPFDRPGPATVAFLIGTVQRSTFYGYNREQGFEVSACIEQVQPEDDSHRETVERLDAIGPIDTYISPSIEPGFRVFDAFRSPSDGGVYGPAFADPISAEDHRTLLNIADDCFVARVVPYGRAA